MVLVVSEMGQICVCFWGRFTYKSGGNLLFPDLFGLACHPFRDGERFIPQEGGI